MNWRKIHRYVGLIVTLPLMLVALTGVILQLRNQFEWIQPSSLSSQLTNAPLLTYEQIFEKYGKDVDQVIYRPGKQNLALRMKDGMELQIHPQSGELLKKAVRRTNLLIDIHQGSWMGKFGQYFIHFTTGLALIFLIVSGVVIYPFKRKRNV